MRRAVVLLLALAAALPASANMASPVQPGSPAGEPVTSLAGLRVARETLTLDLRPLDTLRQDDVRFATVEAVYGIVNTGDTRVVPLVFVALGQDTDGAQVWLDGVALPVERLGRIEVPALWTGIAQAPGFDGAPTEYDASVIDPTGVGFSLAISPGQHQVRVRYRVRAGSFDPGDHPNRTWQVAYSLAPARLWAGFGQLDVEVLLPEGWESAASLPLRAEPARLVGRFGGVPGDVLAVSVRAPIPAGRRVLHGLAFLAALLAAAAFGVLGGIAVGRQRAKAVWALPVALLGGVAAAASLILLRSVADGLGDSTTLGYGAMTTNILILGPLTLALGTALAQTVAGIVARRIQTGRPQPVEPFGPGTRN